MDMDSVFVGLHMKGVPTGKLSARSESECGSYSHITLCDSMDCNLPCSSVHGILQARVLGWVAISFSRGSSQPKD